MATGGPIMLTPNTAPFNSAPFVLSVNGSDGFNDQSGITFAGQSKPTTFVNGALVTTTIDWTVLTGPGVVPVWVITDGVSTDPADFTVTDEVLGPEPTTPDEMLTAQLRAWGISGEPLRWAPSRWMGAVESIRFANTGFGSMATVQGMLDSTFPYNDLHAADVCLNPPAQRGTNPLLDDLPTDLPDENTTWLVDGLIFGHGPDVDITDLPPGTHQVEVRVAVGGVVYSRQETVDVADPVTPEKGEPNGV